MCKEEEKVSPPCILCYHTGKRECVCFYFPSITKSVKFNLYFHTVGQSKNNEE